MGAKTVEEIVAQFVEGCSPYAKPRHVAQQAVNDLRAAGLLLEPGQRERIIDRLRFWVKHLEDQGVVSGHGETEVLLRELAGAGVVDEPAPLASAPRRMVNAIDGEHDEDPQCAGIGCQPVAPSSPVPRRMFGMGYGHDGSHDEKPDCSVGIPCKPDASTEAATGRGCSCGHTPHDEDCWAGMPAHQGPQRVSLTEAAGPSACPTCHRDKRVPFVDGGCCCLTQPPHVHQWAAILDEIRALGWSVAVHNDYRLRDVPHTFWLFTKDGRAVKGEGRTDAEALTAVREHCVADGCTEPPAVREVRHGA